MPNTKSAEKRTRSNVQKTDRNRHVKSRVRTLEKTFRAHIAAGENDAATSMLSVVFSTLDKGSKNGVFHWATVNRKKARLAHAIAAKK
ncbi:MAG: 30S ribosomal protein S20 [Verrucomicrobiia bacterium]|jgi:small subunit ribosomal protein S20